MTVSVISSELLILLRPDAVWWYIIISGSVLRKDGFAVFEVKVAVKVQNFIECLSGLDLRNDFTFCSQTEYRHEPECYAKDLLLLLLLSSRSKSQANLFWSCLKIGLLCSGLQWWFRESSNVFQFCIFCATDSFATKLCMLMCCY